jgi:hypothetical protein
VLRKRRRFSNDGSGWFELEASLDDLYLCLWNATLNEAVGVCRSEDTEIPELYMQNSYDCTAVMSRGVTPRIMVPFNDCHLVPPCATFNEIVNKSSQTFSVGPPYGLRTSIDVMSCE